MLFNKPMFVTNNPEPPPEIDYLCFTSSNSFSVGMSKTGSPAVPSLEYSKDKTTWATFTAGITTVSANANEKVYLRGNNNYISAYNKYWSFNITGSDVRASGNIMSLLDETCEQTDISYPACFSHAFANCTPLTTAPALPATTIVDACYSNMFSGCTSLTDAPELPATDLAVMCYSCMFYGCTSLTTAPSLPATDLAYSCYGYMFSGCTSLTTVPALPADSLSSDCYGYMFHGCSSLRVYSLSGEGHDKSWSIPTSGTASRYTTQDHMFYGTTGDYSTASSVTLNQTFYTQNEPI